MLVRHCARSYTSSTFKAVKFLENRTSLLSTIEAELDPKDRATTYIETYKGHPTPSLALSTMMNAGMHFGHSKSVLAQNFRQYALGVRHGIVIIDLDKTLPCLRRACLVAYDIARLGGIILLVGTRPSLADIVERYARSLEIFFISTEWKYGTLTNAKRVLKPASDSDAVLFISPSPEEKELGPLAQRALFINSEGEKTFKHPSGYVKPPSLVSLPDLVIVLDGPTNEKVYEECNSIPIPTIGIIDSNFDPTLCTYPIPANDDSVVSVELVLSFLSAAIRDGKSQLHSRGSANTITQ